MSFFDKSKTYPFKSVLLRFIIAAALVFADAVIKLVIEGKNTAINGVKLIPGVLGLSYVHNTGAAFGILDDNTAVVSVVSVVIIIVGVLVLALYTSLSKVEGICLAVVIAGGIGNQIDRFARGYVTDYLKFLFIDFPVFNLADVFVTCGCIALAVFVFLSIRKSQKDGTEGTRDER